MLLFPQYFVNKRQTERRIFSPFLPSSSFFSLGVPSAPRNIVSLVNQTSLLLEWHSPRDTGHRDDLSYNVLCHWCHSSERRACQPCDDSVAYVPGKRGLKETRVEISKLRAHTSYTFDIQVCPLREGCIYKTFLLHVCCSVLLKDYQTENVHFSFKHAL